MRSCFQLIIVRCRHARFSSLTWSRRQSSSAGSASCAAGASGGACKCMCNGWCVQVYVHRVVRASVCATGGTFKCMCNGWCVQVYVHVSVWVPLGVPYAQ